MDSLVGSQGEGPWLGNKVASSQDACLLYPPDLRQNLASSNKGLAGLFSTLTDSSKPGLGHSYTAAGAGRAIS